MKQYRDKGRDEKRGPDKLDPESGPAKKRSGGGITTHHSSGRARACRRWCRAAITFPSSSGREGADNVQLISELCVMCHK
ncbi:unnamed protein product [Calypogeia fissa]